MIQSNRIHRVRESARDQAIRNDQSTNNYRSWLHRNQITISSTKEANRRPSIRINRLAVRLRVNLIRSRKCTQPASRRLLDQCSYCLLENWVTSTSLITGLRQLPPSESIVRRLISRGLIFPRSSPPLPILSFLPLLLRPPRRRGHDLSRGSPRIEGEQRKRILRLPSTASAPS